MGTREVGVEVVGGVGSEDWEWVVVHLADPSALVSRRDGKRLLSQRTQAEGVCVDLTSRPHFSRNVLWKFHSNHEWGHLSRGWKPEERRPAEEAQCLSPSHGFRASLHPIPERRTLRAKLPAKGRPRSILMSRVEEDSQGANPAAGGLLSASGSQLSQLNDI